MSSDGPGIKSPPAFRKQIWISVTRLHPGAAARPVAAGVGSFFGVERPFYQLAHNLVVSAPPLASLRKFGTVAANHENARLALESGAALLVYPGGDYEVFRPFWERNKVDFGARAT